MPLHRNNDLSSGAHVAPQAMIGLSRGFLDSTPEDSIEDALREDGEENEASEPTKNTWMNEATGCHPEITMLVKAFGWNRVECHYWAIYEIGEGSKKHLAILLVPNFGMVKLSNLLKRWSDPPTTKWKRSRLESPGTFLVCGFKYLACCFFTFGKNIWEW